MSCLKDQLSISADNATLRSVLVALQTCLGVKIEIPPTLRDERSFIRLGPGPARTILQELLSSTDLDYVLQPSDNDPEKLNAILLMPHLSETSLVKASTDGQLPGGMLMSPSRRAWMESRDSSGRGTNARTEEESEPREAAAITLPSDERSTGLSMTGAAAKDGSETSSVPDVRDAAKTDAVPIADAKADSTTGETAGAIGPPAVAPAIAPSTDIANVPATISTAAPTDGSDATPESRELQRKIIDMQQLFEERKRLNANPGGAPSASQPPT